MVQVAHVGPGSRCGSYNRNGFRCKNKPASGEVGHKVVEVDTSEPSCGPTPTPVQKSAPVAALCVPQLPEVISVKYELYPMLL